MCKIRNITLSNLFGFGNGIVSFIIPFLIVFGVLLNTSFVAAQYSTTATYTSGNIQTDRDFTGLPGVSSCFGELTVTIPVGAVITSVDVEYDMTASGGGRMSHQRSYLRCVSTNGTDEVSLSAGVGNSTGTYSYKRTGLTIANNVGCGGGIVFQLHAGRTSNGNSCDIGHNRVDNNTWKVTVHYKLMDNDSEVSKTPAFFVDSISATTIAFGDRFLVLDFRLSDLGTSDGSPTIIDSLYITQGAYNEFVNWTDFIAGASLYGPDLGENSGSELIGHVYSNKIIFKGASIISVPNAGIESYQLRIWLNPAISSSNDNKNLDFELLSENIFTPICLPSSSFEDFGCSSGPIAMYFPRDENSTIIDGEGEKPHSIMATHASFGERIKVFDIKFIDLGTGDGADTKVEKIVFTRGVANEINNWQDVIDGATLYGPQLGLDSGSEVFGVVDSNSITFAQPLLFAIPDEGTEVYELRIWLNDNILTSYDTKRIEFELDYTNITTCACFSSLFGSGNVVSGEILLFPKDLNSEIVKGNAVEPEEISSSVNTEADRVNVFSLKFKDIGFDGFPTVIDKITIAQDDDNEISDWTSVIAGASLYGPDLGENTGVELFGFVNENNIIFEEAAMIKIDNNSDEDYEMRIWLKTDSLFDCKFLSFSLYSDSIVYDTLGSGFLPGMVYNNTLKVIFEKEDDLVLIAADSAYSEIISSTKLTFDERQGVLQFMLTDTDIDRFNTIVEGIIFEPGCDNKIDNWSNVIAGASLYGTNLGEQMGSEIQGTVNDKSIVFEQTEMISIAAGDTHTYELRVWLHEDLSAINNKDTFSFKLLHTHISTAACFSSTISSGSTESKPVSINIEATKLIFEVNYPPLYVEQNMPFTVTVLAVDENNNFDDNAVFSVTLDLFDGSGALHSDTGLTQNLSEGKFTWSDVSYDAIEQFQIIAHSASLHEIVSHIINCVDEFSIISKGDSIEPDTISSAIFDFNDRIMVFDVTLTDKATADGLPTVINAITFTQSAENNIIDWRHAIAGATLFGPQLGQTSGIELEGTIDSTTIVFEDSAMIAIPDGEEQSYYLKIWLNEDLSAINEFDKLGFRLCYTDIVTDTIASSLFGAGTAESKPISVYFEPVMLEFVVDKPPSIVGLNNKFNVTLRVKDFNNNYSTSYADTLTLSLYSGAGVLSSDTGLIQPMQNGSYTWTDISFNQLGFFRISAESGALTGAVTDSLESVIDYDSELSLGLLPSPAFINSFNCSFGKRAVVFDITFTDKGTFDGLPTIIEEIVFKHGAHNKMIDWRNAIDSASLYGNGLGEGFGVEIKTVVDSAEIVFSATNMIVIPDGTTHNYQLKIWLKEDLSAIVDKDTFDISLNYEDIRIASYASSEMGSGEISTGPVYIDIVATKLVFHKNQPPSIVGFNHGFVVTVRAVDDNDNHDTDATDLITVSLLQGSGLLTSTEPFTQNLINGSYTWIDAKYNKDEVFRLRAVSNNLKQGQSGVIMCKKCVRSALYTFDKIDSDRNFTSLPGASSCPGVLSIYMPTYAIITGVDVFYSITTHATPGHRSHQRSQVRCVSPGGISEDVLYHGSGAQGTQEYQRFNLPIANNVSSGGFIDFELHVGRSSKGNGCGHSFNWVENNTWSVVVNYIIQSVFWTGERNSDWNNIYNWGCEVVPTQYFDVIISADAINMPVISTEDVEVRDLFIESGANIKVNNGKTINIYGHFTNDGILDIEEGEGKIAFCGNGSTPTGRQSVKGSSELRFRDVTIEQQAFVKLEDDVIITGDLTVAGTLEATTSNAIIMDGLSNLLNFESGSKFLPKTGAVRFEGKQSQRIKSNGVNFYNFGLKTSSGTDQVIMLDNLRLLNSLSLERGALNLNCKTLTLANSSPNAIIRDSSHIGFIYAETDPIENFDNLVKWDVGASVNDYYVPFGKAHNKIVPMGMELTKNNMGANGYLLFSTYSTTRDNLPLPSSIDHFGAEDLDYTPSDYVVDRFWYFDYYKQDSKQDADAPVAAHLKMSYLQEELDHVIETSMMAQRYNNERNQWAEILFTQNSFSTMTAHGFSTNTPVVEEGGVGSFRTSLIDEAQLFNVWILTDYQFPLPIKLISFDAVCLNNNIVEISWATATEINNHFFTIEKSYNGLEWREVARIEGAYNSSTRNDYSILDQLESDQVVYYRLKQTDFDGKFEIFHPIVVNCKPAAGFNLNLYPNPANDILFINLVDAAKNTSIFINDILGRQLYLKELKEVDNNNKTLSIDLRKLPDGVYIFGVISEDNIVTEKFIKQR